MKTLNRQGQRGITILTFATMLAFLLIPMVGLVVDVGVLYNVKARLQTAVDGAALAAGRGLSRSADPTAQQATATLTANRWYLANLPTGYMGVTPTNPTVTFPTASTPRTIIVQVDGSVQVPTYFMRIFNVSSTTVKATGQSSRRFVNIMMVLDRSGSIYQSGSCGTLASAASQFVSSFVSGSSSVQQDRLGMVTFGTDYRVDFPPAFDFNDPSTHPSGTLSTMVNNIYCYGFTNSASAYWTAYQQLVALNDTGALNVLLFFTDGEPNTLTFGTASDGTDNRLPVKSLVTPTAMYGYANTGKSPCQDSAGRIASSSPWAPSNFTGVLAGITGTGTFGLFKKDAASYPITQSTDSQKPGSVEGSYGTCYFDTNFTASGWYAAGNPSRNIAGPFANPLFDTAYLPAEDIMRNPTGRQWPSGSAVYPVSTLPSSGWPASYAGKIALDATTVNNAGKNALDNAAKRARADSVSKNLSLVTYTIGLGASSGGPDLTLLQRIANDSDGGSANFDSSYPEGISVYAADSASLNSAFQKIAAEVLRLSR